MDRPTVAPTEDGARPAGVIASTVPASTAPTEPTAAGATAAATGPSFRALLTVGLIASSVLPVAVFGGVVLAAGLSADARVMFPLLIAVVVAAAFFGLLAAAVTISGLTAPLRRITAGVERVAAGESSPPILLTGDDELARLADSHNRIAAEVARRNRELGALLVAIAGYNPADGLEALATRAELDACTIYSLIDCRLRLADPATVPVEETVPGDPRPVRAGVRAGNETLGVLTGHLPATRNWERADQDLLDLFASEVGVALRNADLFGQIDRQNERLLELDAAKDEFLRSVSHNLQTPLTSIRAYVDQLLAASDEAATDRRLQIVGEQTDRLTRLVRQLLTVTRLEAGALRPEVEVIALGPRVRRAWEALNAPDVDFELRDEAGGWLAVADPDQLDQVLWALLDNAVKYGGRDGRVEVAIRADDTIHRLHITISDHGPGVAEADRERLFTRFTRGATGAGGDGTGLGLYVSRELLRTMSGMLWLEPPREGRGAAFTLSLPGEPPGDED
ncbi:MAG: ATP-binding protein [Candidatus Limnocylindrales bacterium]|jgi:K+-sensing histidine kinase KdpD